APTNKAGSYDFTKRLMIDMGSYGQWTVEGGLIASKSMSVPAAFDAFRGSVGSGGGGDTDRALRIINSIPVSGQRYAHITFNLKYDGTTYTQGLWSGSSQIKFEADEIQFYADVQAVGGSETTITPT